MAINYRVIQKGKPGDPDAEKLYYAIPVKSGDTTFEQIVKRVMLRSTAHKSDVLAVLTSFFEVVREELDAGRGAQAADLFKMRVSFSSKGKKNKNDVSAKDIVKKRIVFKLGKEFREMLDELKFVRID